MKTRSFFFFTAANPEIEFGGMFGERKSDIYKQIPDKYLPKTYLIPKKNLLKAKNAIVDVGFPAICKPNVGERGFQVQVIHSETQLLTYIKSCSVDFLVQEYIQLPIELGVFYIRFPGEDRGKITSIVQKRFLTARGDGKKSIQKLLEKEPRAVILALDKLEQHYLEQIPAEGQEVVVEPIGNHSRGTTFLNANSLIDTPLSNAFDQLSSAIPNFYYGRFDLKCQSLADLCRLRNFKILELNGVGAQPAHIFQPGYSLLKAYRDIFYHLSILAKISQINKRRGFQYWEFKEGFKKWQEHKYNIKLIKDS